MHELGVILNMLDTLEAAAKRNNVKHIETVSIDVGEMTGIVPTYMKGVWPEACNGTVCMGSELYINVVKAVSVCADCGAEYLTMENAPNDVPTCPKCKSTRWTLKEGDGLVIKEIGVRDD